MYRVNKLGHTANSSPERNVNSEEEKPNSDEEEKPNSDEESISRTEPVVVSDSPRSQNKLDGMGKLIEEDD